jgi:hypothetical protein
MVKKTAAERLAAVNAKLTQARSAVGSLEAERDKLAAEVRAEHNELIKANVDALLLFATHQFHDCTDGGRQNPRCVRCRLLSIKADGYVSPDDEFTVSITYTENDTGLDRV